MGNDLPTLIQNPTPDILALIKAGQQRRWAELNVKTTWTPAEFEQALFCHQEYIAGKGEWFYSEKTIRQLAFDARTPDQMASKLQLVVAQMTGTTQLNQSVNTFNT